MNQKPNTSQQSPSHSQLARAHARQGAHNIINKTFSLSQNLPESKAAAVIWGVRTGMAGAKSYAKSAYHAGMGITQNMMRSNPNDGRALNNIRISMALRQGKNGPNKGISSFRQKSASRQAGNRIMPKVNTSNAGIKNFKAKTSGKGRATARTRASTLVKRANTSAARASRSAGAGKGSRGGQSK